MRLVGELPAERAERAAACLGFEIDEVYEERVDPPKEPDEPTGPHEPPPPESTPLEAPSVPFWRLSHMTFVDVPEQEVGAVEEREVVLTRADLDSPGCSVFATPRAPSLTPWHRLWPVLRSSLQVPTSGNELDVDATRRAIERGEVMQRVPRRLRSAWASRVSVWIDRSPRLVPFWSDQSEVYDRLSRICGKAGTKKRVLDDRAHARAAIRGDMMARFRADPNCPVLVLGDLGIYGSGNEQVVWRRTARRLRSAGVHVAALVPCPPARFAPVAHAWSAEPWERGLRAMGGRRAGDWNERALSLLRLASAALLIQPGLLRSLRRLLPAACADASTEADAWNHPHVQQADGTAMELHPEAAARLRAELPVSLQAQVTETIARWHAQLPQELRHAETLVWHALGVRSKTAEALTDALDFAKRLEGSMRTSRGDRRLAGALQQHAMWLADVMPKAAFDRVSALQTIRALAFQGVPGTRFSKDLDPATFYGGLPTFDPGWWAVRQVGDSLTLSPSTEAWPSAFQGAGSPVAWLLAARREVWWRQGGDAEHTQWILGRNVAIPLRPGEPVEIRSDRCTVRLSPWRPEPWAVEAGRDGFGLWADAEVNGVVQRFRWIPPGRFMMGSQEREYGRHHNEGPSHQVTWTQGRWLADSPVTQALWEAVMGDNPSTFKGPDHPVESVSWEACQMLLKALNMLIPELDARLPSEAEWEHACRAGTPMATWAGDLESEAGPARVLNSIAWYGGNCRDGFEWRGSGTRSVRGKQANPMGLYDMLGNVHEWCLDAVEYPDGYERGRVVDPAASRDGLDRTVRGGSWSSDATHIRAAHRVAYASSRRSDHVGFRLAREAEPRPRSGREPARDPHATAYGEDGCGFFMAFAVGRVVQRMRWVHAGRFLMGSPESEEGRFRDEGPQHQVTISEGFWVGDTPCTQALWEAVMGNNPSRFEDPGRPVERVSWQDCIEFLARLNETVPWLDGRLPTEAEWEYACRAGTTTATWVGDLNRDDEMAAAMLARIAWCDGSDEKRTGPVAKKQPNPLGLYDMLGNVFEWCQDGFGPYGAGHAVDPLGSRRGSGRVIRGGSWRSRKHIVRAAYRSAYHPSDRDDDLGFRLARGRGLSTQTRPWRRTAEPRFVGRALGGRR